tara:strand:- start:112 stop:303 length:192 start_codon:yes stop_codon:yes gene_type:complete
MKNSENFPSLTEVTFKSMAGPDNIKIPSTNGHQNDVFARVSGIGLKKETRGIINKGMSLPERK